MHVLSLSRDGDKGKAKREKEVLSPSPLLFPNSEALDQVGIPIRILLLQIVEQASALPHELQQATAGVVILGVSLKVLREVVDALAQESDLNFW
jgi:hypothetical protein